MDFDRISIISISHFAFGLAFALSRISPRVRVRVSVGIVYRIATGGYSWIWPQLLWISYFYVGFRGFRLFHVDFVDFDN